MIVLDALEITPAEAAELPRGSTGRVRVLKTDAVAVRAVCVVGRSPVYEAQAHPLLSRVCVVVDTTAGGTCGGRLCGPAVPGGWAVRQHRHACEFHASQLLRAQRSGLGKWRPWGAVAHALCVCLRQCQVFRIPAAAFMALQVRGINAALLGSFDAAWKAAGAWVGVSAVAAAVPSGAGVTVRSRFAATCKVVGGDPLSNTSLYL